MYKTITVAGAGFVGTAIINYITKSGQTPLIYDPPKGNNDVSVLKKSDIVFIAVPTPYTKIGFDLKYVEEVLPLISENTVVVIKSTVLPGTTDKLQSKYPNLKFIFSPEFLSQKTANADFINPTRQIVGYTKESKKDADKVLKLLPRAKYQKIITATEAEMVKYMNNAFYALKVTYANQIYDLCEALDLDYENVAEAAITNEPWMGTNHWDVMFGDYRGYGGKCLPKDVRSLIQLGKEHNIDVSLLENIEKLNNKRTKQ